MKQITVIKELVEIINTITYFEEDGLEGEGYYIGQIGDTKIDLPVKRILGDAINLLDKLQK